MNDLGLALLAIPAGVVGFASAPCCVLLGPAYLPYVVGLRSDSQQAADLVGSRWDRGGALGSLILFMVGFASFFTLLGATASAAGAFVLEQLPMLEKVAAAIVIVMGVALLGRIPIPGLRSDRCLNIGQLRSAPLGALGMGVALAITWTPCTGPTLGAILALAATSSAVFLGMILLFLYSIGLSAPFLALAVASARGTTLLRFQERHRVAIERTGSVLLIVSGILLIVGGWQGYLGSLTEWLARQGWPPI